MVIIAKERTSGMYWGRQMWMLPLEGMSLLGFEYVVDKGYNWR